MKYINESYKLKSAEKKNRRRGGWLGGGLMGEGRVIQQSTREQRHRKEKSPLKLSLVAEK